MSVQSEYLYGVYLRAFAFVKSGHHIDLAFVAEARKPPIASSMLDWHIYAAIAAGVCASSDSGKSGPDQPKFRRDLEGFGVQLAD